MQPDCKYIDKTKTYLITGAAGFIGYFLAKRLLECGCRVIGIDNMNNYYDVALKYTRLEELKKTDSSNGKFIFIKGDISDKEVINPVFSEYKPNIVVNLAAQAGVRYSIENPDAYIQSNTIGFLNILESCRHSYDAINSDYKGVEHLVYASSSSVYGANKKVPFSEEDFVDNPVSLYAATKKSNELMAYTYSHLYKIPATGLRFFTVYGPMGRPDMAYFSFSRKIMNGEPIKIFNHGDMYRDFTYIDDIVTGVERLLCNPPDDEEGVRHKIYNIGNNKPERLMHFIETLEMALSKATGKSVVAEKVYLPMQMGDVPRTYASTSRLERAIGFKPGTGIEDGLMRFANWFKEYYRY
ncbi:dTDP-glucose 4,6-dehydratase [Desulfocucumis palustris]|uniref:dTDP-glucose 4,6-dehydratase n=1 Tax=Desulfocucumis palustris TaxID=1898651 RepID=A0A2L2XCU8_9FIRM|nr:GDP-mannose 4,6-dehydratase [Desulfocucumis palustris]GBF33824.1 dTDP-glucose 4,6-dehydratase [Desulfocucumis palustris]